MDASYFCLQKTALSPTPHRQPVGWPERGFLEMCRIAATMAVRLQEEVRPSEFFRIDLTL